MVIFQEPCETEVWRCISCLHCQKHLKTLIHKVNKNQQSSVISFSRLVSRKLLIFNYFLGHMTWDEIEEIMRFKLSRLYMLHSSVISSIAKGILRACQDADRSESKYNILLYVHHKYVGIDFFCRDPNNFF